MRDGHISGLSFSRCMVKSLAVPRAGRRELTEDGMDDVSEGPATPGDEGRDDDVALDGNRSLRAL